MSPSVDFYAATGTRRLMRVITMMNMDRQMQLSVTSRSIVPSLMLSGEAAANLYLAMHLRRQGMYASLHSSAQQRAETHRRRTMRMWRRNRGGKSGVEEEEEEEDEQQQQKQQQQETKKS